VRTFTTGFLAGALGGFMVVAVMAYSNSNPIECLERCTVIEKSNSIDRAVLKPVDEVKKLMDELGR